MSERPYAERYEHACRLMASTWLPGQYFDEALAQAHQYHRDNPPLEFGAAPHLSTLPLNRGEKNLVAAVHDSTAKHLLEEHRTKVMRPFMAKDVPPDIAGHIVDTLVFGHKDT